MPTVAYRIIPKAGFHFGREGLEQHSSAESFSSDSFFSALIATVSLVEPDSLNDLLGAFPPYSSSPALRLSSLFPIVGELPLFPRPRLKIERSDNSHNKSSSNKCGKALEKDDGSGKALKKIEYVSMRILNLILSGTNVDKYLLMDDENGLGRYLQNGAVWIAKDEQRQLPKEWREQNADALKAQHIWDEQLTPRVSIDRISNASNIYHIGRTVFAPGCGLWFIAEMMDDAVQAWFENILNHLQDEGIGGERSAGYGSFAWERMSSPCQPSIDSDYVMLLSRYHPTSKELQNSVLVGEFTSYELVDVGGYVTPIGEPARKRQRVRLIEAGSIVRGGITGQLVDVSPTGFQSYAVYRSGIALAIPVNRKGKS